MEAIDNKCRFLLDLAYVLYDICPLYKSTRLKNCRQLKNDITESYFLCLTKRKFANFKASSRCSKRSSLEKALDSPTLP